MERIGQFRILELLGRGGMGVVYKALDERLERVVALKVLPESNTDVEERRARFLREARSAARVTHPSIVGIYEAGSADGRLFIAMELVDGESLRRRLSSGPLSVAVATRIAIDVASALVKAHSMRVVHRDLKPDNVMLTADGHTKVLDFGIAKVAEVIRDDSDAALAATEAPITREGQLVGTPGYMSPEQALGAPVDARTDVFALGVLIYEMLSGRLPWKANTGMELLVASTRDAPHPIAELVSAPVELLQLVSDCLERDREKRCSSAEDALRRLTRAKELLEHAEAPTDLAATGPGGGQTAVVARKRSWPKFAAFVAVPVIGAALFSWSQRKKPGEELGPPAVVADGLTLATQKIEGCNEAATAEMRKGLAALRGAAWDRASRHFERATQADPECAPAFLRVAMVDDSAPTAIVRTRFQRAAELKGRLSPRDAELFDAQEPALARDPPALSERKNRMLKLAEAHPNDAEYLMLAAFYVSREDRELAEKLIRASLRMDSGYADAWQSLSHLRRQAGDMKGARDAVDHCISESASTTDCIYERIRITRATWGTCKDLESDAKLWIARETPSPNGRYFLGLAMAGQGEREAGLQALRPRWSSLPEDRRTLIEKREAASLAVAFGDLAQAQPLVKELGNRVHDSNELVDHAQHAILAIDLANEMGRTNDARELAESTARGLPAWSRPTAETQPELGKWFEPWLVGKRRELGAAEVSPTRELERWRALDDVRRQLPIVRWAFGEALPAVTPTQAIKACETFPPGAQPDTEDQAFVIDFAAARALFLADRSRDAEPFIRTALGRCDGFELPFLHAQARLLLGRVLRKTGDVPGACAAYRALVESWANSKPVPATAQAARKESAALKCP